MKFTKFQLLNITTGTLHTNMKDIYDFFDQIIVDGIMTHMLPKALKSIKPIMERKFPDMPKEGYFPDFKQGNDIMEIEFNEIEKMEFWNSYTNLPDPLLGKDVIIVKS